jgi:glucokinase
MSSADLETPALVGDVGGTNCRFALASRSPESDWTLSRVEAYRCDAFPALEDAVGAYLAKTRASVSRAAIAVAGPVEDGAVSMTNRPWRIVEGRLADALGLGDCRVLNDFEALAHALPALGPDGVRALGPDRPPLAAGNLAVLGAGTGLGVAGLVRSGAGETVVVGEGGHIAFAPQGELESAVRASLARRRGFVAVEHVLSGPGLVNLHRALCEVAGTQPKFERPETVTAGVAAGDRDAMAVAALFAQVLGSVAGDLALVLGARGGVFVAGGVSPRLLGGDAATAFRARFEAKGDFSPYVAAIPTGLVVRPDPGLLGAARALDERR